MGKYLKLAKEIISNKISNSFIDSNCSKKEIADRQNGWKSLINTLGNSSTKDLLVMQKNRNPYIDYSKREPTLIIPHNSDPKYHWWNGGKNIEQTLKELNAPVEMIKHYLGGE
ncbi:MAG: hypothetical protein HQK51_00385 [Oligoflexia bacterium]|nr:hypothetical protein [Oligoflexia bacterium]